MATREEVITKLKELVDPHTGINVWEMGMVKDLEVEDNRVSLTFEMTSNFCPIGMQLGVALKRKLAELPLDQVDIKIGNYLRASELESVLKTS
ncbi:MAG: iron-sulfur cluster assembly protein [Dehalococcoidia bacterium]|nr:iron-sulfur cluster assembly protein [Dehalococcoidia bacterium]